MLAYPVDLTPDDGCVLVTAPDLPEVTTFGEDRDDAMLRAVDAIEEVLATRIAHKDAIPAPSAASAGRSLVRLPTQTALKVALYRAMQRRGVSKAELARRLHVGGPHIDRLLDLNHASRLDSLDAAFAELGITLTVTAEPVEAGG